MHDIWFKVAYVMRSYQNWVHFLCTLYISLVCYQWTEFTVSVVRRLHGLSVVSVSSQWKWKGEGKLDEGGDMVIWAGEWDKPFWIKTRLRPIGEARNRTSWILYKWMIVAKVISVLTKLFTLSVCPFCLWYRKKDWMPDLALRSTEMEWPNSTCHLATMTRTMCLRHSKTNQLKLGQTT